ncbi:MAG: malonate decarboxylase holo-ACP synthase [Solibacillus sp.]
MEINVHDILLLKSMEQIQYVTPAPQWLFEEAQAKNLCVVRRMKTMDDIIPIGFRGNNRSKRYASFTTRQNIEKIIKPVDVLASEPPASHAKTISALKHILRQQRWGIGGSVGFTMATSILTCHKASDVDVILYKKSLQELDALQSVYEEIKKLGEEIDVQVEIDRVGSVSLEEYLLNDEFLIKSATGPQLQCKQK